MKEDLGFMTRVPYDRSGKRHHLAGGCDLVFLHKPLVSEVWVSSKEELEFIAHPRMSELFHRHIG